jgi:hypothetical protein
MAFMRRGGSALAAVLAFGVIGATGAGGAVAVTPVAPNQYFVGVVNGRSGPAVIRMACFGPVSPGEKGHPLAGQTLAVRDLGKVPPPPAVGDIGFTGPDGHEIGVFFGPLPPSAAGTPAGGPVIFTHYGVTKPIPTSVLLPCSGTGSVPFVPIPVVGGSHDAVVPVTFVGQP